MIVVVCSCKEKTVLPVSPYKLTAEKNGVDWESKNTSGSIDKNFKKITVFGAESMDEYLSLQLKYTDLSNLESIKFINSELNFLVGGDVVINSYSTDPTDVNNFVKIMQIDTVKKIMTGNFEFRLIKDKRWKTNIDTITYKKGQFVVNYTQYPK